MGISLINGEFPQQQHIRITMDNLNILLAAKEETELSSIKSTLSTDSRFDCVFAETAEAALRTIKDRKINVAVVAEELRDTTGLLLINSIVAENPFINCALASPLAADEFHEETEGLGIFMQLPVTPGSADAVRMLELLEKIYSL